MPTERPRVTITVSEDQLKEIEDYRFSRKLRSQTQAINDLVRAGLEELKRQEAEKIEKASSSIQPEPEAVKKNTVDLFRDVLGRAGLLGPDQDISDNDLEFLKAMFLAMKAHFQEREEGQQ